jgi:hypothetical protein|tara:strand:+ start:169 stop:552 length:384 start_codon:yes stop_codon:yes gene_type:complete
MIAETVEMIKIGKNENGEDLYNLKYVKGGRALPTPSMTKAEALAMINGTEVEDTVIEEIIGTPVVEDVVEEVVTVTVTVTDKTTIIPDYKDMDKKELEALMRTHDIELDRRKSKKELMMEVDSFFKG